MFEHQRRDVTNRDDVELLVRNFYRQAAMRMARALHRLLDGESASGGVPITATLTQPG